MMTPMEMALRLESQLRDAGVPFDDRGWPVPDPDMVMRKVPSDAELHTIDRLGEAQDKTKTVGVSFMADNLVYRRIEHLDDDIPSYKRLLAFGGFDLSPRIAMAPEMQRMNMLISVMATVRVGLANVPLIPNFRIGGIKTLAVLAGWPKSCPYVVGALGCARGETRRGTAFLRAKLLVASPSELLIYGSLNRLYRSELDREGVAYRVFQDRRSRGFRHVRESE